jgi:hypothetical protein
MVDHAMFRKKPVQPEAIPSGFETAHDRRFHAQFCRHFLPQIRDQGKQCLGIARLHSMETRLLARRHLANHQPGGGAELDG